MATEDIVDNGASILLLRNKCTISYNDFSTVKKMAFFFCIDFIFFRLFPCGGKSLL